VIEIDWFGKPRQRLAKRGADGFPQHGKLFSDFSTVWKKCFHGMEKTDGYSDGKAKFFHAMENIFANFPWYGRNVSMLWKTRFWGCF